MSLPKTQHEGDRAKAFRERVLKLKHGELAEKVGVTQRSVYRYEESGNVPDYYRLAVAAVAAGLEGFNWTGPGGKRR